MACSRCPCYWSWHAEWVDSQLGPCLALGLWCAGWAVTESTERSFSTFTCAPCGSAAVAATSSYSCRRMKQAGGYCNLLAWRCGAAAAVANCNAVQNLRCCVTSESREVLLQTCLPTPVSLFGSLTLNFLCIERLYADIKALQFLPISQFHQITLIPL